MNKYSVEDIIIKLISHFELKNMSELAEKLNVSQSVMSNWKARNAIGAICEKILEVEPDAMSKIFSIDKIQVNNIDNSSVSDNGSVIDNSNNKSINTGSSQNDMNNNVPSYVLDDLNNLFSRATEKNKTKEVIEAFDDFIHEQKKLLR